VARGPKLADKGHRKYVGKGCRTSQSNDKKETKALNKRRGGGKERYIWEGQGVEKAYKEFQRDPGKKRQQCRRAWFFEKEGDNENRNVD